MLEMCKNNLAMDVSNFLSTMNTFHASKRSFAEAEREHRASADMNARRAASVSCSERRGKTSTTQAKPRSPL